VHPPQPRVPGAGGIMIGYRNDSGYLCFLRD
jgi:hypothetical protein